MVADHDQRKLHTKFTIAWPFDSDISQWPNIIWFRRIWLSSEVLNAFYRCRRTTQIVLAPACSNVSNVEPQDIKWIAIST